MTVQQFYVFYPYYYREKRIKFSCYKHSRISQIIKFEKFYYQLNFYNGYWMKYLKIIRFWNGRYLVNANLVTQSIIFCTFINITTCFTITDKIQQIFNKKRVNSMLNLLRLQPVGHRHSAEPMVLTHSWEHPYLSASEHSSISTHSPSSDNWYPLLQSHYKQN